MVGSSPLEDRDGAVGEFESGCGARGGPLLMPALGTGVISVRNFQRSCITLLSVLESELDDSLTQTILDDDTRVDDLKIVTDAELVDKALAEVLEGRVALVESPQLDDADAELFDQSLEGKAPQSFVEAGPDVGSTGTGPRKSEYITEGLDIPGPPSSMVPEVEGTGGAGSSEGTGGESERQKRKEKQGGKKRGRPYDRSIRSITTNGDDRRTEALARLKQERESARDSCSLNMLLVKNERDSRENVTTKLLTGFFTSSLQMENEDTWDQFLQVGPSEVVLHLEIYHGLKRHIKTQEFLVLGSQTLTALRDKIYCLTNDVAKKAGMYMPSGYFLIEDVFYNDMRDPNAIDYSVPYLRWIDGQKEALANPCKRRPDKTFDEHGFAVRCRRRRLPKLPTLSTAMMAETVFLDLKIRIGAPYLFCHQGDCKHTVIFRDLRLIHQDDVQNALSYPVLKFIPKLRYRKCSICSIYRAKKVTYEDMRAPSSPCFFCDNCYYVLHYSEGGVLLYSDFKVYEYYHE